MFNEKSLLQFIEDNFNENDFNIILNNINIEERKKFVSNPIEFLTEKNNKDLDLAFDYYDKYLKNEKLYNAIIFDMNNDNHLDILIKYREARERFFDLQKSHKIFEILLKKIKIHLTKQELSNNFLDNYSDKLEDSTKDFSIVELRKETIKKLNEIRYYFNGKRKKRGWKKYLTNEFNPLYKKYSYLKPKPFSIIVFPIITDKLNIAPNEWKLVNFSKNVSVFIK